MRRLLVFGIAGLLALIPQIKDAAARGGFGGGGFHGGGMGGFHGGSFGGFHAGAGVGGFHGGLARAGFAPGFGGVHPGWHNGGVHWAGAWHPGSSWHRGWSPGWGWHRPWRVPLVGAIGYGAYDYGYYNSYGYDCPLNRHGVWDGHGYRIVWTRSCDYQYW